jgi:hypothetical protein
MQISFVQNWRIFPVLGAASAAATLPPPQPRHGLERLTIVQKWEDAPGRGPEPLTPGPVLEGLMLSTETTCGLLLISMTKYFWPGTFTRGSSEPEPPREDGPSSRRPAKWARKASFKRRWNRSMAPLDWGWYGMVRRVVMPNRRVKESQTDEQNWLPLSEVIC